MRCGDCNKFVGVDDTQDPELDLSVDGCRLTGTVRVVNCCAECGTELREASFDIDEDFENEVEAHVQEHTKENPSQFEMVNEDGEFSRDSYTEGRGRGKRTFYGFTGTVAITCACGKMEPITLELSDHMQASHMGEV